MLQCPYLAISISSFVVPYREVMCILRGAENALDLFLTRLCFIMSLPLISVRLLLTMFIF